MPWVLDLDGVVWLAEQPIEGAAEAIRVLRDAGEQLAFVTNNSYARRADVERKLAAAGIDPGDDVVTSAMAAGTLLVGGERVYVCGGPGVVEAAEVAGCEVVDDAAAPVDVVVVGFNPAFDFTMMAAAARGVRRGARLIATNDDATYPTPSGPIPGGGAILASVQAATGVAATVAGKPHQPMVDLVRGRLGDGGIVVGDRPETDGRFAVALGYRFGLVLSGVTTQADLPVRPEPDAVAADLRALTEQFAG